MNYHRGSDRPWCYQISSGVLVDKANCGKESCACGEGYVVRRYVRAWHYADLLVRQVRLQAW